MAIAHAKGKRVGYVSLDSMIAAIEEESHSQFPAQSVIRLDIIISHFPYVCLQIGNSNLVWDQWNIYIYFFPLNYSIPLFLLCFLQNDLCTSLLHIHIESPSALAEPFCFWNCAFQQSFSTVFHFYCWPSTNPLLAWRAKEAPRQFFRA